VVGSLGSLKKGLRYFIGLQQCGHERFDCLVAINVCVMFQLPCLLIFPNRPEQYIRSFSSTTSLISQSRWSIERRCSCLVPAQTWGLRQKDQRWLHRDCQVFLL